MLNSPQKNDGGTGTKPGSGTPKRRKEKEGNQKYRQDGEPASAKRRRKKEEGKRGKSKNLEIKRGNEGDKLMAEK